MARVSGNSDTDLILPAIGLAVRQARKALGLSQEALADAAFLDRSHMGRIERGERNLTVMNLARVASALGVRPSKLLELAGL